MIWLWSEPFFQIVNPTFQKKDEESGLEEGIPDRRESVASAPSLPEAVPENPENPVKHSELRLQPGELELTSLTYENVVEDLPLKNSDYYEEINFKGEKKPENAAEDYEVIVFSNGDAAKFSYNNQKSPEYENVHSASESNFTRWLKFDLSLKFFCRPKSDWVGEFSQKLGRSRICFWNGTKISVDSAWNFGQEKKEARAGEFSTNLRKLGWYGLWKSGRSLQQTV